MLDGAPSTQTAALGAIAVVCLFRRVAFRNVNTRPGPDWFPIVFVRVLQRVFAFFRRCSLDKQCRFGRHCGFSILSACCGKSMSICGWGRFGYHWFLFLVARGVTKCFRRCSLQKQHRFGKGMRLLDSSRMLLAPSRYAGAHPFFTRRCSLQNVSLWAALRLCDSFRVLR